MATGVSTGELTTLSVTIDTDLSSKAYHFVKFDATDDDVVNLCEDASQSSFILLDDGDGSSTPVTGSIALAGVTKCKIGGTVAAGDKITATTAGVGITTTTNKNHYYAIALRGGATGDIIPVLVVNAVVSA